MSNTAAIRAMLHSHPDGIRAREIHDALPGISRATTIMRSLHRMPDAYIDRWHLGQGARGQFEAVWCAAYTRAERVAPVYARLTVPVNYARFDAPVVPMPKEAPVRQAGKGIRLDGPGIQIIRGILEDYQAAIESLSHRDMVSCHRDAERRAWEIRTGKRKTHDVIVASL